MQLKTARPELFWAVSGGLLASSCCVLQLVLNAFSVGCAGFSVLTPYRPVFAALTSASLAYTHHKYRDRRRTLLALALAFSLGSAPEIVDWPLYLALIA
ncbi:hypothetical protein WJX73_002658 [Symbiochloris irregularis]|uniref:Uncharacterized protein n=1 Tax=Symbiochloris irregularis TaxID=706552 RepID=A0AAW1NRB2_9CHLO